MKNENNALQKYAHHMEIGVNGIYILALLCSMQCARAHFGAVEMLFYPFYFFETNGNVICLLDFKVATVQWIQSSRIECIFWNVSKHQYVEYQALGFKQERDESIRKFQYPIEYLRYFYGTLTYRSFYLIRVEILYITKRTMRRALK